MDKCYFELAESVFSIEGEGAVFNCLVEEFQPILCDEKDEALVVKFCRAHSDIGGAIYAGPILVSETAYRYSGYLFSYQLMKINEKYYLEIVVSAIKKWKHSVPDPIRRLREMSNLSFEQIAAKNIIYNCFDYVFQHVLVSKGKTFVHASSGVIEERGVAFFALGGVGKSSSLLALMHKRNMKYLSDDLGVLSENGDLFYNPKKIQIYAYNLVGQKWLEKLLFRDMKLWDRLAWYFRLSLYGNKGVRRRVAVESVFGVDKTAQKVELVTPLYLERGVSDSNEIASVPPSYFAKKVAYVLVEELKPFCQLSLIYKSSFPRGNLILSPQEMLNAVENIVRRALETKFDSCVCVNLAQKIKPGEMIDFFEERKIV